MRPQSAAHLTHGNSRSAYKGEAKSFKRSPRQGPRGGNIRKFFRRGKALNDNQRTTLFDSRSQVIGYLTQSRTRRSEFTLFDTTGTSVGRNDSKRTQLRLQLESRPCMVSGQPDDYGLFLLGYARGGQDDFSPLAGLRALVRVSDLPPNAFSPRASNRAVISAGWLQCNRRYSSLSTDVTTYAFPDFAPTDRYLGRRAARACAGGEYSASPSCGTQYQNYAFPRGTSTLPSFPRLVLLSESSTGIGAGGIARGVLRVDGGLTIRQRDEIAYTDHNVPCARRAVAKWRYASIEKVYGWLPSVEPDGYERYRDQDPNCPLRPTP